MILTMYLRIKLQLVMKYIYKSSEDMSFIAGGMGTQIRTCKFKQLFRDFFQEAASEEMVF